MGRDREGGEKREGIGRGWEGGEGLGRDKEGRSWDGEGWGEGKEG